MTGHYINKAELIWNGSTTSATCPSPFLPGLFLSLFVVCFLRIYPPMSHLLKWVCFMLLVLSYYFHIYACLGLSVRTSFHVCVCVCVHGCWGDWTSRSEQFSPTWFDQLLIELERVTRGSERLFIVLQPSGAFAFGGLAHSHTCKRTQSCSYSLTANTHAHSPPGVPTPYAKSKLNN